MHKNSLPQYNRLTSHILTAKALESLGGKPLLDLYNNSIVRLVTTVYPEQQWSLTDFTQVDADILNKRKLFDKIEKELNIINKNDWYNVSFQVIKNNRFLSFINKRLLKNMQILTSLYHNCLLLYIQK